MFFSTSSDLLVTTALSQFGDEQSASGTATQGVDGTPTPGTEVVEAPLGGNFFTMLMLLLVGMIVFSMFSGRKQKNDEKKRMSSRRARAGQR